MTVTNSSVAGAAAQLLDQTQAAFDVAVLRTAKLCAPGGKLDPKCLDEQQGVSYEIALVNADLLAAQTLVRSGADASEMDANLAMAFIAEAVASVVARLQGVYIALGLDAGELHAISASDGLRTLRREASSPAALARLGKTVAFASSEIADVAVDEQTAMARDAFRRFAADVVAPMAEKIHRHDLTVPESLLEPMREVGVFGLSIPEEYGGSSPEGHENTPMMIAVTEALSEASLAAAGSLITRPEILARALLAGALQNRSRIGCRASRRAIRCVRSPSPSPTTARTSRAFR